MIISKQVPEEKILSKSIVDITMLTEVAKISSHVNFAKRYNWAISNII